MSLVVCACFENFVVVAADSRAIKIERGCVIPIGDRYCKFWTVGDGMIAVGSTGSLIMNRMLSRFSHEVAKQYRDNPEGLFAALEQAIPEFVRIVNPEVIKHINATYLGETIPSSLSDCNLQKSVPVLCGYDSSQKKIRAIYWEEDLVPVNCEVGSIIAGGPQRATELVTELISKELDEVFMPGDVAKAMKDAIDVVAENSEVIGGAIRTHVIMTPSFKQDLKRFNETCELGI